MKTVKTNLVAGKVRVLCLFVASVALVLRNKKVFFALIVLVNFAVLAVFAITMPSAADASPVLTPVADRESYTLDEGEWDVLLQIQQQCYDLTCGNRTSTVFDFDVASLLGTNEWVADGKGVVYWEDGAVINYNDFGSRVGGRVKYSMNRVLAVLTFEKPSLTEWFRGPSAYRVDYETSLQDQEDQQYACVVSAKVSCAVRPEFANGNDYEVRPDSIRLIQACIERAQSIVNQHAGEEPLTRISSYAGEIYGLTTYDHGAAYDDYAPCGFTSVFDDSPSTMAVCAGYTKAFKLLVELSGATDIQCHTIEGMIESSNAHVIHAWNTVRMPDGRNYMADITNNSPDAAGAGMVLICPANTEGDWYGVQMMGQTVHYMVGDLGRGIYQPDALELSNTPYAQPQQIRAFSLPIAEEDVVSASKQNEGAEPAVAESEKPSGVPRHEEAQKEEPKRMWDIPLVDNKEKIALTDEDMGEYPSVETSGWSANAAYGVIALTLLGAALVVLL